MILAGLALALVLLIYFVISDPNRSGPTQLAESVVASPAQEQAISGLPVRLKIPSINVEAAIEPVGLTAGGDMGAPKGPDEVVWYEPGPRPGDSGSAVLAGHYGRWKNGAGSVFDDLNKLQAGDNIFVEDENGVTAIFVVRESRSFEPEADAADVFSSSDGQSHLNLITCEGTWNEGVKGYTKRLVVFADKE